MPGCLYTVYVQHKGGRSACFRPGPTGGTHEKKTHRPASGADAGPRRPARGGAGRGPARRAGGGRRSQPGAGRPAARPGRTPGRGSPARPGRGRRGGARNRRRARCAPDRPRRVGRDHRRRGGRPGLPQPGGGPGRPCPRRAAAPCAGRGAGRHAGDHGARRDLRPGGLFPHPVVGLRPRRGQRQPSVEHRGRWHHPSKRDAGRRPRQQACGERLPGGGRDPAGPDPGPHRGGRRRAAGGAPPRSPCGDGWS